MQLGRGCGHPGKEGDVSSILPEARIRVFRSRIFYGVEDSCSIWTAGRARAGYGIFYCGPEIGMRGAHVIAWELAYGPLSEGQFVCHDCPGGDNPACCNPEHLFLGTCRVNLQDAARKKMMASGERHGSKTHPDRVVRGTKHKGAKLTEQQVREIRDMEEPISAKQLGDRLGISVSLVNAIRRRERWAWLED